MTEIQILYDYVLNDIKVRYPGSYTILNEPLFSNLTADLAFAIGNDTIGIVEIRKNRATTGDIAHLNLLGSLSPKGKKVLLFLYAPVIPYRVRELAQTLGIEANIFPKEITSSIPRTRLSNRITRITTPSAWRVVYHFITHDSSSINRAALESGTSYSWAHRVIDDLLAQGLVERKGRSSYRLVDLGKLVNGIAWERPLEELEVNTWPASSTSLSEVFHDIIDADPDATITGYLAVQEYFNIARRVDLVQVYSSNPQKLERHLGSSNDGIKVSVLRYDRTIKAVKAGRPELLGIKVVDPVQLVLDLAGLGFAAQDILQQVLGEVRARPK